MSGPKTPEGKAVAARNSLRHGLASRDIVFPEENKEEFLEIFEGFRADFKPQGLFEDALVMQLAAAQWRLLRIARIESGYIAYRLEDLREDLEIVSPKLPAPSSREERQYVETTSLLGGIFYRSCSGDAFVKLCRYDSGARRAFFKALLELRLAQARRASPPASPPLPAPPG